MTDSWIYSDSDMCTSKYMECGHVDEVKTTKRKLTKREQKVMVMHDRLPDLTEKQREWMLTEPWKDNRNVAYYWKRGRVWCQHCGHVEEHYPLMSQEESSLLINMDADIYTCPNCGKELRLKPYDYAWKGYRCSRTDTTIVTTIDGYTVFRTFETMRLNVLSRPTEWGIHEVMQNWVCPDGREVILSRAHFTSFYNGVKWDYQSPFCPRKKRITSMYYSSDTYDVRYNYFYPVCRVSAIARRNGWQKKIMHRDVCPIKQVQNLLISPIAEMLVKTGQLQLFNYWTKSACNDMDDYIPSVRICNRKRYIIKDASVWIDYIDLLKYFHKDIRNAHYVCPANLMKEHDRLSNKKARILEEKRRREEMAQAKKREGAYKKLHGMYFGICFGNEDITVSVVSSVQEMALEGAEMHHCVYVNAYYRKENSLILSAKDCNGNRLETIELDLKNWSILQSRGKYNQPTDRHQDIIKLVEQNMDLFKRVA